MKHGKPKHPFQLIHGGRLDETPGLLPPSTDLFLKAAVAGKRTPDVLSLRPDSLSISEFAELTGVEPHVIRYWEQEFQELKPASDEQGNLRFDCQAVEIARRIKQLRDTDQFTISQIKKIIRKEFGK
ncbi:MAG: MerR family transcriptional regulator [Acidobacteria bacterium]|nr:MerR family transcriptional regulator [Acidobacteriota bacterium]